MFVEIEPRRFPDSLVKKSTSTKLPKFSPPFHVFATTHIGLVSRQPQHVHLVERNCILHTELHVALRKEKATSHGPQDPERAGASRKYHRQDFEVH
jgi:hypothetical protein